MPAELDHADVRVNQKANFPCRCTFMEERVTVESWEQFVAFAEVLMRNVFGLRQPVRSSLTGEP